MEGITEEFTAAVRGFHFYKRIWAPSIGDELPCEHEANNAFDIFAIKVMDESVTVGHLPLEISRITKYIIARGATVTAIITSDQYRRSPLVQGGLEVPCKIRISLPTSILNCRLMDRYDMLHSDLYVEPTYDVGVGSIHPPAAAEATVLNVEPTRKKLKQKNDATGSKDIRSFFSFTTKQNAQEGRVENTKKNNPRKKTVVISDDSESESETSDVNISFSSDDDDLNDMSLPGIPDLDLNSDDSDTY